MIAPKGKLPGLPEPGADARTMSASDNPSAEALDYARNLYDQKTATPVDTGLEDRGGFAVKLPPALCSVNVTRSYRGIKCDLFEVEGLAGFPDLASFFDAIRTLGPDDKSGAVSSTGKIRVYWSGFMERCANLRYRAPEQTRGRLLSSSRADQADTEPGLH